MRPIESFGDQFFYFAMIFTGVLLAGGFVLTCPQHAHHIALLIALLLVISGILPLKRYRERKNWIPIEATILLYEERQRLVVESQYGSKTEYLYPAAEYKYGYKDNNYQSSTIGDSIKDYCVPKFDWSGRHTPKSSMFWHGWEPGKTITVFINPGAPEQSTVIRAPSIQRVSHYLALILAGVICVGVWYWLLSIR